jgi:hypothetical protein
MIVLDACNRDRNSLPDGTGTNYLTVPGLTKHVIYSFRVQARNLNAAGYEAGITMDNPPLFGPSPVPVDQPGRVQSLTVTDSTLTSVRLDWLGPPSASPYFYANMEFQVSYAPVTIALDGSVASAGADTFIARVTANFTTVSGLTAGTIYRFRVQARNNNALGYERGTTIISTPVRPCNASMCAVRNVRRAAYSGQVVPGGSQVRTHTLSALIDRLKSVKLTCRFVSS